MDQRIPVICALVLLSLLGRSQAACSPCPFQWREHQHHCYLYFSSPLPYGQAEEYCRSQHARRYAGGLAALDSVDEVLFIMDYVGRVLNGPSGLAQPKHIRLGKVDESYDNYGLIYYNPVTAVNDSDHFLKPCDTLSPAVEVNQTAGGNGTFTMVPAPEVVEQKCAVYAGEGAYLDLGDFAGTCVSDSDACASEAVTWSVWIKIDSRVPFKTRDFYLCTGAYNKNARGVCFFYDGTNDILRCGSRSLRKSWGVIKKFDWSRIPKDTWIHLAATVDPGQAEAELTVYLDGYWLAEDSTQNISMSTNVCTKLVLGVNTPCPTKPPSSDRAGSAAYSNLMVFDNLLTPEQIYNLYACGSLDWGLKVRSLHLEPASVSSGSLRYVCKASASTGPTIYWRLYHADQAQWEDLGPSSEPGVDITATSLSTCVVQSVLVIGQSRGPSSDGDIVSCSASSGSLSASVYLQGNGAGGNTVSLYQKRTEDLAVDGNSGGDDIEYLFIPESGQQYYQSGVAMGSDVAKGTGVAMGTDDGIGNASFICERMIRN